MSMSLNMVKEEISYIEQQDDVFVQLSWLG